MSTFGDLLQKIAAKQDLTPGELDQLRLQGNDIEGAYSIVKNSVRPGSTTLATLLPIEIIESVTLLADEAAHVINVPQAYNHLLFSGSGRCTATPTPPQVQSVNFTFNNDGSPVYKWGFIGSWDGNDVPAQQLNQSNLPFGLLDTDNCPAGNSSGWFTFMPHYRSNLDSVVMGFVHGDLTPNGGLISGMFTGGWNNTDPITSITLKMGGGLGGSLKAGTTLSLYGIL